MPRSSCAYTPTAGRSRRTRVVAIENTTQNVEILVYAGLFLFDSHPDLPDQFADKARPERRCVHARRP